MRQVYALLGLVKKWGAERVEAACRRALEAEAINVGLIGRMLERGTEAHDDSAGAAGHRDPRPGLLPIPPISPSEPPQSPAPR